MKCSVFKFLFLLVFFGLSFCTYGQKNTVFPYHFVSPNENVYRISLQYNVPVDSIRIWNNLDPAFTLITGQRLIISGQKFATITPPAPPGLDLVQHTDTAGGFKNSASPDSMQLTGQSAFLQLYSEPVEKDRERTFYDTILFYFHKSNFLFRIILLLNLVFILSVIFLSFVIYIRRLLDGFDALKEEECKERYRDFITDWLYEEPRESVPDALKNELKDKIYREVFASELLMLHANLTGESAGKLVGLFHLAGLKQYTIHKAHDSRWHIKAKGFRELAQMKITEENSLIKRYLNSPNDVLRIEAQLAWIQLNPDDPLAFYDDPLIQLTEWGQLNTLVSLKKIEKIPDFGRWLQSSTRSVVIFALRMSGILKTFGNVELISQRLHDPDHDIRYEAIIALGKMAVTSPVNELRQLFAKEVPENKTELLRSLTIITDDTNVPFFEQVLLDEPDLNLRILATKGLVLLGTVGAERVDLLYGKADPELKKIIIHAKDNRI